MIDVGIYLGLGDVGMMEYETYLGLGVSKRWKMKLKLSLGGIQMEKDETCLDFGRYPDDGRWNPLMV